MKNQKEITPSVEKKGCHSFWRRECLNKDIKCSHCCYYFSIAEYEKMTKKYKNKLGIS